MSRVIIKNSAEIRGKLNYSEAKFGLEEWKNVISFCFADVCSTTAKFEALMTFIPCELSLTHSHSFPSHFYPIFNFLFLLPTNDKNRSRKVQ